MPSFNPCRMCSWWFCPHLHTVEVVGSNPAVPTSPKPLKCKTLEGRGNTRESSLSRALKRHRSKLTSKYAPAKHKTLRFIRSVCALDFEGSLACHRHQEETGDVTLSRSLSSASACWYSSAVISELECRSNSWTTLMGSFFLAKSDTVPAPCMAPHCLCDTCLLRNRVDVIAEDDIQPDRANCGFTQKMKVAPHKVKVKTP
jgi:hypothetical protein